MDDEDDPELTYSTSDIDRRLRSIVVSKTSSHGTRDMEVLHHEQRLCGRCASSA